MPDVGSDLLALSELNRPNTGITLDFAHVLYAEEMPAHAAAMVGRFSRLLGVHLNDGYGKRDDGLMIGSVHPIQTVELFVEMNRLNYDSTFYFERVVLIYLLCKGDFCKDRNQIANIAV